MIFVGPSSDSPRFVLAVIPISLIFLICFPLDIVVSTAIFIRNSVWVLQRFRISRITLRRLARMKQGVEVKILNYMLRLFVPASLRFLRTLFLRAYTLAHKIFINVFIINLLKDVI